MNKQLLLLITLINLIASKNSVNGQDQDTYFNEIPSYNFEKGLGIVSPDSSFLLNFRFRMQNRITYLTKNTNLGNVRAINAAVKRLRLKYAGYVFDPKLTYEIQLGFSTDDIDIINTGIPNILRDAVVFYHWNKSFTFALGQTKLPGNREHMNSSGSLELVDRSLANLKFNIDRDFGIQAYYSNNLDNLYFSLLGAVSTGEGRNVTLNDAGLAYTVRIDLLPLGKFKSKGNFFEGDILHESSPRLGLGFAAHLNQKTRRAGGQTGYYLFESRDLKNYFMDLIFKYNGWALMADYLCRKTTDPVTTNSELEHRIVYSGHGTNYQASYVFLSNWEIIGRFTSLFPEPEILPYEDRVNQYTIGITKYIRGHRFKIQSDISFEDHENPEIIQIVNDNWQVRFQIELGI